MKQIFFTPGPSQIYPTVKKHLQNALKANVPSISHRSKQFEDIFFKATDGMRNLLNIPKDYHIVFVGSGTEAMERILQNCVEKYSFHFSNGAFGERFFGTAKELQKSPQKYDVSWGQGFSFGSVSIPKETELICVTQNETSIGFALDMQEIYRLKQKNPNILIAVDTVSSAPYASLDYTKLDCVFFSVQKGFGLPAGLGVVIISPQTLEKAQYLQKQKVSMATYHSFPTLVSWAQKNQTMETPNVLAIYLLGKVIEDMQQIGIETIRQQQEEKAQLLYDFFDNHKRYKPFIKDKKSLSQTVVVIEVRNDQEKIISNLEKQGLMIGEGYGEYKKKHIRIAQFPAHTATDVKKLLTAFKKI